MRTAHGSASSCGVCAILRGPPPSYARPGRFSGCRSTVRRARAGLGPRGDHPAAFLSLSPSFCIELPASWAFFRLLRAKSTRRGVTRAGLGFAGCPDGGPHENVPGRRSGGGTTPPTRAAVRSYDPPLCGPVDRVPGRSMAGGCPVCPGVCLPSVTFPRGARIRPPAVVGVLWMRWEVDTPGHARARGNGF